MTFSWKACLAGVAVCIGASALGMGIAASFIFLGIWAIPILAIGVGVAWGFVFR